MLTIIERLKLLKVMGRAVACAYVSEKHAESACFVCDK